MAKPQFMIAEENVYTRSKWQAWRTCNPISPWFPRFLSAAHFAFLLRLGTKEAETSSYYSIDDYDQFHIKWERRVDIRACSWACEVAKRQMRRGIVCLYPGTRGHMSMPLKSSLARQWVYWSYFVEMGRSKIAASPKIPSQLRWQVTRAVLLVLPHHGQLQLRVSSPLVPSFLFLLLW